MYKWKALIPVAFSVAVLTLAAVRAQQQRADRSSNPSTLTALDYLEIQQLVTRYAYALDSGADNGQMYAGLFAPDGVFVQRSGEAVSGRDALAALAVRNQKGPLAVFHFIMNHVIEAAPGGAIGKQYLAQLKIGEDGQSSEVSGGGRYEDVSVKDRGGWGFSRPQFLPSPSGPQPSYHSSSFSSPVRVSDNIRDTKASALTPADYVEIQQLVARYPYGLDTGAGRDR